MLHEGFSLKGKGRRERRPPSQPSSDEELALAPAWPERTPTPTPCEAPSSDRGGSPLPTSLARAPRLLWFCLVASALLALAGLASVGDAFSQAEAPAAARRMSSAELLQAEAAIEATSSAPDHAYVEAARAATARAATAAKEAWAEKRGAWASDAKAAIREELLAALHAAGASAARVRGQEGESH